MASAWNEREVFLKALGLPKEQLDAYLQEACPDIASRERIDSLLRQHANRGVLDEGLDVATPVPATIPGKIGQYRIIRRLGEGGTGVVYLVEDPELACEFALKVLHPQFVGSEQALARFREEARSAAMLNHPAIVRVFRFDQDNGIHYIVSEFVDGPTLEQVIRDRRGEPDSMSTKERFDQWCRNAAEIIATIADALSCAHKAHIIHRDVKPSNILIDKVRGPRLTDFSIAKHLTEENRSTHTSKIGTPYYMSPEQASIANAKVDERSDIFSLGVVLYELLTMRRPFTGATQIEILKAVAEKQPPRLRLVDKRFPKDLEVICQTAMEKRPLDRYQTAGHVVADLTCYLEGRPILAVPPSKVRVARYWMRSHRVLLLSSGCLIAIVIAFCAIQFAISRSSKHWHALRCAVDFKPSDRPYLARFRVIDLHTFKVAPREESMQKTDQTAWLLPGQYRVEFQSQDGLFDELDCLFLNAGDHYSLTPTFSTNLEKPSDMVLVPGGTFSFGRHEDLISGEPRNVNVESFLLDKYEVTNRQFMTFVKLTGHPKPKGWGETWPRKEHDNYPVVGISRDDIEAYAHWAHKRLPTVLEWEYAARWPNDGSAIWDEKQIDDYAWATAKHLELMNQATWTSGMQIYEELARPVDSDPHPSKLGLHYMFGNAGEMTNTITASEQTRAIIIRNGSWMDKPDNVGPSKSDIFPLGAAHMALGFRCAKSAVEKN